MRAESRRRQSGGDVATGRSWRCGLLLGLPALVAWLLLGGCSGEPIAASSTGTPLVSHGAPNESEEAQESCIACHACGADQAPLIDRGHATCTECHGPAPDFVAEIPEGGGCGFKMDCTKQPPEVNCWTAECHRHTLRETNRMCEQCHAYASGP